MQHIRSISDLNPQSVGFGNRAAESINIIGHVLEDLLNGFGGAIASVTGQPHGSHLGVEQSGFQSPDIEVGNIVPRLTPSDRARIAAVNRTVVRTRDTIGDTKRVQDFIDERF